MECSIQTNYTNYTNRLIYKGVSASAVDNLINHMGQNWIFIYILSEQFQIENILKLNQSSAHCNPNDLCNSYKLPNCVIGINWFVQMVKWNVQSKRITQITQIVWFTRGSLHLLLIPSKMICVP